jgi:hypothetical protein
MGPVSILWYRERSLTQVKTRVLEKDSKFSSLCAGDTLEFEEITEYYSTGRIERRSSLEFDGGDEIRVPPMRAEDWRLFSDWLDFFSTDTVWELTRLVSEYEKTHPPIQWFSLPSPPSMS